MIWPLFIYYIVQNAAVLIGVVLTDRYEEYSLFFLLISAIVCVPIYLKMYRKDKRKAEEFQKYIPLENKDILAIALSGAALALAMNNIISLTPLPIWFTGYEDTNEILYSGGLLLQILSAGIFACAVEELSMRGVVYQRMKRYWGKRKAMILSAALFGIYHLNVVQAVYAFFLGLFFVWLYERYDSLWASILGHISANLFVILLSESGLFDNVYQSMVSFCLTTCIAILIFYYGFRWMKQTNPLIDLEFVKKAPDTLESLTKEYKEQEREE